MLSGYMKKTREFQNIFYLSLENTQSILGLALLYRNITDDWIKKLYIVQYHRL